MIQLEVFMLDYHYQIKLDNDRELECFTNWYLSDVPCESGYKPKVFWDGDHVIVEHIDKSTGKTYKVRMTRELFNIELDRWPYFGLIGKPVSKDEAFTIISEYYPFKRRKVSSEITFNITEEVNYVNQYVDTDAWCMFKEDEKSWIRPDGRIGLFDSSYIKIPDFYELVLYWENMAKIDGIDVYIGITSISSAPCMACPYCRYVMNKYTKRKDISEDIDFPEDSMTNEEILNKLHDGGWLDDEWGYFFSCNGAELSNCREILSVKKYVQSRSGQSKNLFLEWYDTHKIPDNIADYVIAVLHITDGLCDVRCDEEAINEYKEILGKYYPNGVQDFDAGYSGTIGERIFSESFVKRCLQKIGVNEDNLDDIYASVTDKYYDFR